jgi:hypothetical protein
MINWLKGLRSFLLLASLFGFLFSATLVSCGNKKEASQTEHSEGGEHPTEEEHPTEQ